MLRRWRLRIPAGLVMAGLVLTGCGSVPASEEADRGRPSETAPTAPAGTTSAIAESTAPPAPSTPTLTPTPTPTPTPAPSTPARSATPSTPAAPKPTPKPAPLAGDGEPRPARLSIPALDLENFRVRPHRGRPDDARGTRIQDRGATASPYGTGGLVGPGGLGNYLITGHRTSSTQPFEDLPDLRNGARVHVVADGRRYTYRIVDTRRTSFRSKRSLAKQSAAVPGRPGVPPTRAMITLSTCRTPEDRAEGNNWSDRFGNPEHRIDKIGVLVAIRPA